MNKTYELIPSASTLLSSLRSVGYTEETAIADIVDNSISSGATKIELQFDWDKKAILISDNGEGMDATSLLNAMKIGSFNPLEERSEEDLGRFGLGMKTAAFSIARKLMVLSKKDGMCSNAQWDLDYVESSNKWEVLVVQDNEVKSLIDNYCNAIDFKNLNNGTLIIMENLDKLIDYSNLDKSKKKFYKTIEKIKEHLSMIFHRFIEEDNLEIFVNGNVLLPWNPFYSGHQATMELASEELYDGKNDVLIQPYILPHKNKFLDEDEYKNAGGSKGWFGQQGFYVYRNRRLIVYGTWFRKLKKEPAYNLARIKLDMSSDSDFEWAIDIKKSKATLPVCIEEQIEEIIYLVIEKSAAVYNSRGVYNKRNNANNTNLKYVWEQRKNSSGKYMFYLNKKHPLLMRLLQQLTEEQKKEFKTYLSLVENYSPAMLSGVIDDRSSSSEVSPEIREKDLLVIRDKISVLRELDYDDNEIYELIVNCPEHSYLSQEVKRLLEEE